MAAQVNTSDDPRCTYYQIARFNFGFFFSNWSEMIVCGWKLVNLNEIIDNCEWWGHNLGKTSDFQWLLFFRHRSISTYFFFQNQEKYLGSSSNNRVGRVTGQKEFFLGHRHIYSSFVDIDLLAAPFRNRSGQIKNMFVYSYIAKKI